MRFTSGGVGDAGTNRFAHTGAISHVFSGPVEADHERIAIREGVRLTAHGAEAGTSSDPAVQAAASAALQLITDGARIGLGSGRASSAFIVALGARVKDGLRVSGVATSRASAELATRVGIPLIELGEGVVLSVVVDGADEVAPNLDLVKGWGGALVRERIVTAASARQVILVDASKRVQHLGERGRIPVEVIPLARWVVTDALRRAGIVPTVRTDGNGEQFYVTDNGNLIIDCRLPQPLADGAAARACERALLDIPGVVDTGLFLGTAHDVIVGYADGRVETLHRQTP